MPSLASWSAARRKNAEYYDKALRLVISGRALFGTLLADDIRTVHRCMDDLMNNYRRAIVPWSNVLEPAKTTLDVRGVATVGDALTLLLG